MFYFQIERNGLSSKCGSIIIFILTMSAVISLISVLAAGIIFDIAFSTPPLPARAARCSPCANTVENINTDVISNFLSLIHEVIADSNEDIYNYLLNWISYIIQNPGNKTETAIVL